MSPHLECGHQEGRGFVLFTAGSLVLRSMTRTQWRPSESQASCRWRLGMKALPMPALLMSISVMYTVHKH